MTQIILSFSKAAAKYLKQDFPRFPVAEGEQAGVKSLVTNSVQSSWQVHAIRMDSDVWQACNDGRYVFFFAEAFSRYTLVISYETIPCFTEFYEDFLEQWFTNVFKQLLMAGVINEQNQAESVTEQFSALMADGIQPECYTNYDKSLGGVISDQVQWLEAFVDGKGLREFDDYEAEDFTEYVNQMGKRIRDKNSSRKTNIHPEVRFTEDSAFRFAKGLCNVKTGECLGENYPNPHQHKVQLRVVK